MTTVRFALPVLFTESRTLTVAVCVPPEAPVLFHGIEIGPLDVVLVVATAVPSMLSVRLRVPAAAFSSQIVNHTVPLTVVPSVPGCVMNTRIVPCCTVTLRMAVAVRPLPSCTVSCSWCDPAGTPDVSQLNDAVLAVPEVEKIGVAPPSSRSVQVMVPVPPVSLIPTGTVPPTVAPSVGVVIVAVSGGGATLTVRIAVAVRPAPSCTVNCNWCDPATTPDVSQLNDAVLAVPEVEKIGVVPPSSRSVQVIVPVPPVSLMLTGTVPLTVAPSVGLGIDALSGAATVTFRVAVAVRPPPSCTVSCSWCAPG